MRYLPAIICFILAAIAQEGWGWWLATGIILSYPGDQDEQN